ncbi:penicillin acylase family protein [Aeromicrobium ginsengisoli]|uniref:penicillin acylase family protein n=1 Tax=Aeromicrobium ginsengisoli TaxID=363867 RepID=UPI00165F4BBB|nr:penicillin acylase family protein [Aeromicrobium ginsengisoli]
MRRLAVTVFSVLAIGAAATIPAAAATTAPSPATADSYGTVRNIVPAGQRGSINALQLAQVLLGGSLTAVDGKNAPKNYADQLEMYDDLAKHTPTQITDAVVDKDYKKAGFVPEKVISTETPKPGVTIVRDAYGVPYITGKTYTDTMFGAGFAGTQDRMFLMDALRHLGAGRGAEFVGGTPGNIAMDRAQVRSAYYTPKEAQDQLQIIADENGAEGQRLLEGADAYLAGINAAQNQMCPLGLPTGLNCPAEYLALQKKPTPWTRADLTYVASLVGGIFGKGGGQEYANSIYYGELVKKFGTAKADKMFASLREKNDKEAPTTSTLSFSYDNKAFNPHQAGVAIPDLTGAHGTGSGDDAGSTNPIETLLDALKLGLTGVPNQMETPSGTIDLSSLFAANGMSNALLVGATKTKTGHPLAVFGPQTGYYNPQLLSEQVLMGPGVFARGVSFAGTNLVVELGHGLDYAWSATSSGSDNIDTVMEKLCNADGSAPTVNSTSYRKDGGACVPMQYNEHKETVIPNISAPTPPTTLKMQVWRTNHGIVQTRTTVKGVPVAVVIERSTYGREAASILGFSRFNNPDYVKDATTFKQAANGIDYTFNWFYADNRDIAYFSSGRLPIRAAGTDTDMPRWAGKAYDPTGWLSAAKHPQQINPSTGYLASWNNKPARDFAAADDKWSDGSVHRSEALSRRASAAIAAGKVGRAQLAGIVEDAATEDVRAKSLLPGLLKVLGDDPKTAEARKLLSAWLAAGAHRVDYDRDGTYAHQAAIRIFDTWWEDGDKSLAYDFATPGLGSVLARAIPQPLDDHPRTGQGSSWLGSPWYGYIDKELRQLTGSTVQSPYAYRLCGTLTTCRTTLRTSLLDAVQRAETAQGVSSPSQLTYDKSLDYIRPTTGGVVEVRPIDWQNRPTFQQVVDYRTHRAR